MENNPLIIKYAGRFWQPVTIVTKSGQYLDLEDLTVKSKLLDKDNINLVSINSDNELLIYLSQLNPSLFFQAKIFDEKANNYKGLYFNGIAPQICSQSYLQAIAEGDITNHSSWVKNGYNDALSSSEEDLWAVGGLYIFPTIQQQMQVISSSTNDTNNGTGARTVEIHYLNNLFEEKTEIITLNGTNAVLTTATDIYRINNFRVKSVGSLGINEGNIDIRNTATTPIYSRISAGINRAINAIYTVPKGKCLYVINILMGASSNVANRPTRFITKATYDNISEAKIGFFMPYTNVIVCDGTVSINLEIPTKFTEGVDIRTICISPDGATYASVTLRGWLESV